MTFFFFFNCLQRRTRRNILLQSPQLILFSIVPGVISVLLPYNNRLCGGIMIIPALFREFTVFLLFSMNVKGSQVFMLAAVRNQKYILGSYVWTPWKWFVGSQLFVNSYWFWYFQSLSIFLDTVAPIMPSLPRVQSRRKWIMPSTIKGESFDWFCSGLLYMEIYYKKMKQQWPFWRYKGIVVPLYWKVPTKQDR